MRTISRVATVGLVFLFLAGLAGAEPGTTDAATATAPQNSANKEAAVSMDPQDLVTQSQANQELETSWLQPEPTPGIDGVARCSAPPSSCQCGGCCICFTCWRGSFPVFGCD